jgi:hypothetical protein
MNVTFYVEGYIDPVTQSECSKIIKSKTFKISVEVKDKPIVPCIEEILKPSSQDLYIINFNDSTVLDSEITLDKIKTMFGTNTTCPITSALVVADTSGLPLASFTASLINVDTAFKINVLNNVNKTQVINFYIQAKTDANAIGFK